MKNCGDNVFGGVSVGVEEASLFGEFLAAHDLSDHSRRAFAQDIKKFARWFVTSNGERFVISRVTTRDVADFRNHLRRDQGQAVATVNRNLVTIRRFFGWLVEQGHVAANPAKQVKELKRTALAPKGLDRSQVRKLLREIELRSDVRAAAIFSVMLYSGCRVGDLVDLDLHDLMICERSGSITFRYGKGNKQRTVPLASPARQALAAYLETRPPVQSTKVFVGERGPFTDRGFRALCDKYSGDLRLQASPTLVEAHDGPSILGGQSWRLGWTCFPPRS